MHKQQAKHILPVILLITSFIGGCGTYYKKNEALQQNITSGNFKKADNILKSNTKVETNKNRVLFYLNKGTVNFMLNNYNISNAYFEKADHYIEDFKRNIGTEALALITNPMVRPYKPEDFESVMIHYYKALNYLFLKNYEDALVETRRVNIVLHQLNDKYKKTKNKYSNDAFAHNLMGIIYDASGDKNNAFIAYRNAYEIYENNYSKLFNISAPVQLKKDLLRTAYQLGFTDDYNKYKTKFGMDYKPHSTETGDLVFFWMNGFGPIKAEWSVNFVNTGYKAGWVTFANTKLGLSCPVYIGGKAKSEKDAFKNLSALRVAFPKYVERKPLFNKASLSVDNKDYKLELAENINAIAFQSLKDRMFREIAYGMARLASKKALETLANQENEYAGTILSIINAATEKADTRNWQSLPYSINYARVSLPEGSHRVKLNVDGQKAQDAKSFDFDIKKGETTFFNFHQLDIISNK